jgi:hypothetical protein
MYNIKDEFELMLFDNEASLVTNKLLAKAIQTTNAIVLQEIISIYKYAKKEGRIDEEGYFWCNKGFVTDETSLSRRYVDNAYNFCIEQGLFEVKRKGMDRKQFIKFDNQIFNKIKALILDYQSKMPTNDDLNKNVRYDKARLQHMSLTKDTCVSDQSNISPLYIDNIKYNIKDNIKRGKEKKEITPLVLTDDEKIEQIKQTAITKKYDYKNFDDILGITQILTQIELCQNHYDNNPKYKTKGFNSLLSFNWLLRQVEYKNRDTKNKTNPYTQKSKPKQDVTTYKDDNIMPFTILTT